MLIIVSRKHASTLVVASSFFVCLSWTCKDDHDSYSSPASSIKTEASSNSSSSTCFAHRSSICDIPVHTIELDAVLYHSHRGRAFSHSSATSPDSQNVESSWQLPSAQEILRTSHLLLHSQEVQHSKSYHLTTHPKPSFTSRKTNIHRLERSKQELDQDWSTRESERCSERVLRYR